MHIRHILLLSILLTCKVYGQGSFEDSPFLDVRLSIDTGEYTWLNNSIEILGKPQLPFKYNGENEVAEVHLTLAGYAEPELIDLWYSTDYTLIDSMIVLGNQMRFKIRFNNLTQTNFLKLTFKVGTDSTELDFYDIDLYPYTDTNFEIISSGDELFIGEEQIVRVTTDRIDNVIIKNQWVNGETVNYLIRREGNDILVHLLPNRTGNYNLSINLPLKKPRKEGELYTFESRPITKKFTIKSGRLAFLNISLAELTPPKNTREPIEIEIDNSRLLKLGKTYRIEDQEEKGGALIAELHTRSRMNNGRVLSTIRTYAFHRKSEGYLYIKDNDNAVFVTNFDITPRTKIQNIFIQRPGKDWVRTSNIFPGETINVRFEGEGLHKGKFSFEGAYNLEYDSLLKSEKVVQFRINIPMYIVAKQIEIFDRNQPLGIYLNVKEYQRSKELDFVVIDIDGFNYRANQIDKPIYYDRTITDLLISFDNTMLDFSDKLYGKQYLEIDVKIKNKSGNIIELYQFEDIVVCPGENSPRSDRYDRSDCSMTTINLNNFIKNKTSKLEEWSRIELEIKHKDDSYRTGTLNRKIEIVLKRNTSFDIDVSFPAGLLIIKTNDQGDFANFGGLSLAMMAQMSFYQQGKVAEYRPYKIGAGFIFMNAFSINESNTKPRDVGLVVLASVYPVSRGKKLTFPLYMGFGYFLQEQVPFFMLGPGIQVRF